MKRKQHYLTDEVVREAMPRAKPYKLAGGCKTWRRDFIGEDRRWKTKTFGRYPEVSLEMARRKAEGLPDIPTTAEIEKQNREATLAFMRRNNEPSVAPCEVEPDLHVVADIVTRYSKRPKIDSSILRFFPKGESEE